jgi:hypothetical protein
MLAEATTYDSDVAVGPVVVLLPLVVLVALVVPVVGTVLPAMVDQMVQGDQVVQARMEVLVVPFQTVVAVVPDFHLGVLEGNMAFLEDMLVLAFAV